MRFWPIYSIFAKFHGFNWKPKSDIDRSGVIGIPKKVFRAYRVSGGPYRPLFSSVAETENDADRLRLDDEGRAEGRTEGRIEEGEKEDECLFPNF